MELFDAILEFVTVAAKCLKETSYASDRHVYHHDLAIAAGWLADLHEGQPEIAVAGSIIDARKRFYDIWRQGEWGSLFEGAFSDLLKVATRIAGPERMPNGNPEREGH